MARARKRQRRSRIEAWVGPWLRGLREERDESLATVVERLKPTDTDGPVVLLTTLSRIERGETFFPSDELPKFLLAYKATLEDFAAQDRANKRAARQAAA